MFLKNWLLKPPDLRGLSTGQAGERWVEYLYEKKGYKTVAKNFAAYQPKKLGELDLVCHKPGQLVVVEVKTRQNERFMNAEEAVDWKKQNLLLRMTKLFLEQHPKFQADQIQIDVATVLINPVDNTVKSVTILPDAIEDN